MKQKDILKEIVKERTRQDSIHPEFYKGSYARLGLIMEEVGEIAINLNDELGHENLKEELVQVAALCVRWLEHLEEG